MSYSIHLSINKFNAELSKDPTDFSKSDLADLSSRINQFSDSLKGFDVIDSSERIANLKEKLNSLALQVEESDQVLEAETTQDSSGNSLLKKAAVFGIIALVIAAPFAAMAIAPAFMGNQNSQPSNNSLTNDATTSFETLINTPNIFYSNEMCPVPGPGAMTLFDPSITQENPTSLLATLPQPSHSNEMCPIPGPGAMTVFDPSALNEMSPIPGPGAMIPFDPSIAQKNSTSPLTTLPQLSHSNEMCPVPGPGAMTLFDPSITQENPTSLLATLPQPSHSNEMCPIPGPGAMIPFDPSIAQKNSTSPLTTLPQLSHSNEMCPVPGPGAMTFFDPSITQENPTSLLATLPQPSHSNEMCPIPGPGAMIPFDPSIAQKNSTSPLTTLPQLSHSDEMSPIPGPGAMIPFDPSIAQKNSTSPLTTLPQLSHSDEMSPGPGAIALFDPSIVQENSTSLLATLPQPSHSNEMCPVPGPGAMTLFDPSRAQENSTSNLPPLNQGQLNLTRDDQDLNPIGTLVKEIRPIAEPMSNSSTIMTAILAPFALLATCFSRCGQKAPPALLAEGNIKGSWHTNTAKRCDSTKRVFDTLVIKGKSAPFVRNAQNQLGKAEAYAKENLMSEGGSDRETTLARTSKSGYELTVQKAFSTGIESVVMQFESLKTAKALKPKTVTRIFTPN